MMDGVPGKHANQALARTAEPEIRSLDPVYPPWVTAT